MKLKFSILILLISSSVFGQFIPLRFDNHFALFLEELEGIHAIENYRQSSMVQSEKYIFNLLSEAELNSRQLNMRQRQELNFYLRFLKSTNERNKWYEHDVDMARIGTFSASFNPPGLFIRDSYSGFSITPLAGALFTLNSNDKNLHYHFGIQMSGNIGSFGYYARIKKTSETFYTYENYIQEHIPAFGFTYPTPLEMQGGLSFSNKYITVAAMFDNPNLLPLSNQLSLFPTYKPSFPSLLISANPLPWLSYQFRTGFINTSYDNYLASNYLTETNLRTSFALNQLIINPFRQLEFTLGQAAFLKSDRFKMTYLTPVNLYISGDKNENSLLFYRLKISTLKHLTFSFSHIIDAFSLERVQSDYDKNVHAYYFDASLNNWPADNLSMHAFYNMQVPLFMNHHTSPLYNLWLRTNNIAVDNRRYYGFNLIFKPTFNLMLQAAYKREAIGDAFKFNTQFPYEFETLQTILRKTDILSFEFTIKPAYNTSLFAGIHYVFHKGDSPWSRLVDYNDKIDFFFRTGFRIGL